MKLIMQNLKVLLIAVAILSSNLIHSQQSIVFEKTYRTETTDTVIMALTGAQTSDGGYLLGGYAAYGMYLSQMMFFKIDSVGNYQWKRMYGSLPCSSNMIHDMEPVGDGTFICCGEGTFSTEGEPGDLKPTNSMIMRVDENANILWHKEFDAGWHECLYELALSDTGYMCVGYKEDYDKAPGHFLWINGDIEGNFSKLSTLDMGLGWQHATSSTSLPNNQFALGGLADSKSVILTIDSYGDTIQSIVLGSGYPEMIGIQDVDFTNELLFCGGYKSDIHEYGVNAYFSSCDLDFQNIESTFYEHENEMKDSYSQKIVVENDGSFLIIGIMRTTNRGNDYWLKKHDSNNQLTWARYIGGDGYESLRDVIKTNDAGYLLIGESNSFNDYNSMYIVKIDSLGLGNYTSPVEEYIVNNDNEFIVYPNPASNIVTIEFDNNNNEYSIEIFDMSGRLVLQKISSDYQNYIDVNNLKNGLYMVRIIYENYSYQNKLIINH